jgi:hypothetical protein
MSAEVRIDEQAARRDQMKTVGQPLQQEDDDR